VKDGQKCEEVKKKTFPKSDRKIVETKSIPLTHKYKTPRCPGLVQALSIKSDGVKPVL
jgi:hypothetical protein